MKLDSSCFVILSLFLAASARALVSFEWVTVGDPGNSADASTGYGAVSYVFKIAKHEVTNAQYAEFLNAVAASDPNSLYNTSMDSNARGGITRSGVSGSFSYAVKANMGDKPVIFVAHLDAQRFANWIHNGQGSGSTETGAYTVGNLAVHDGTAVIWIPTEDEWYKAAYYQPASAGGDTDDYWLYPTASNTLPTPATAGPAGTISNPGPNIANYNNDADWNLQNGNVTTVGSASNTSYYGTFDQGGNVYEWNEAIVSSNRGRRGGSFTNDGTHLGSDVRASNPATSEGNFIGFRLAAAAPQPTDADSDGLLDSWELTYWPSITGHNPLDDSDHDGYCELLELALGLNPTLPSEGGLPPAIDDGGYLTMAITKHPGVTYQVQSAGSLLAAQPDSFSAVTTTVLTDDAMTLKVRDNFLIGTSPPRFMRVKVTAAP